MDLYSLEDFCGLCKGCINFPQIYEAHQNSKHHWIVSCSKFHSRTNIRRHYTKWIRLVQTVARDLCTPVLRCVMIPFLGRILRFAFAILYLGLSLLEFRLYRRRRTFRCVSFTSIDLSSFKHGPKSDLCNSLAPQPLCSPGCRLHRRVNHVSNKYITDSRKYRMRNWSDEKTR
jgi:hypothetical protein